MKTFKLLTTALALVVFGFMAESALAATAVSTKKGTGDQIQRRGSLFDLQQNTISNIQFYTTNYGIFGLNVAGNSGGGFWPRNSNNAYIFGGGIWFAALKRLEGATDLSKLVVISYNPNSGLSWMSPGRIEDGDGIINDADNIAKYRTYFSTDFDLSTGEPFDAADGPNWPIWDVEANETLKRDRYLGRYIYDVDDRSRETYPKGPAFISQEDIVSVFKDTDLTLYEGGRESRRRRGYPMRLDFEQTIYSWGFGDYKDFMFLSYKIINRSQDTLFECFMAPAMDMDIAPRANQRNGADNDRTRFYEEDPTLDLAVQWSEGNRGENGAGFGYIGFDFLESPAVDVDGFLRTDKKFFDNDEQLGLVTFRNWVIQNDPTGDEERYDFMAAQIRDGDSDAGDKRFLMATGPFNLRPGDTATVVVGLIIGSASTDAARRTVPDGSEEDLAELVRKDKFAQTVYDDNFRAPVPPVANRLHWQPLDNGMIVTWDSLSELSVDSLEDGLDFFGYRLFRARRLDLDTFAVSQEAPSLEYSRGKGPLGWKQIASFSVPPPFLKKPIDGVLEYNPRTELAPQIDSLVVLGLDQASRTYQVARFGNGLFPAVTTPQGATVPVWVQGYDDPNWNTNGFLPIPNGAWYNFFRSIDESGNSAQQLRDIFIGTVVVSPGENLPAANDAGVADSLYQFIRRGTGVTTFADIGDRLDAKEYVITLMDSVTGGFRFIDVGDDNGDGVVTETDDIATTEKLINNVDYFYSMLAFDEGDFNQGTPGKFNSRIRGRNQIATLPLAPRARKDANIEFIITPEDSVLLGGLYNFRLDVLDYERLAQLYSGHTFEVTFEPVWLGVSLVFRDADGTNERRYDNTGLYARDITIRDLTEDRLVASYPAYNFNGRNSFVLGSYAENGAAYVATDTLSVGIQDVTNATILARGGAFNTRDTRWRPDQFIGGTFAFGFDHFMQQYGGTYRAFDATIVNGDANANVTFSDQVALMQTGEGGRFESFNNGPGIYELEFLPGGSGERVDVTVNQSGGQTETHTFDLTWLTVRVRNVISYNRPVTQTESVAVSYPGEMGHQSIPLPSKYFTIDVTTGQPDTAELPYPDPRNVDVGSYNLSAYGWVDGRESDRLIDRRNQAACENTGCPVGTQGRYYLSATSIDGAHTIDFTHFFVVGGVEFGLDFANKRGRRSSDSWEGVDPAPSVDFEAGDVVRLSTFGGGLGLPLPGAKVQFKINEMLPELNEFTDGLLEQVKVVPNPYVVTHIGQPTTDQGKIYFTHLPQECTIKIYTINGDLIRTINHVDGASGEESGTRAFAVWDLLSDGRQRVGSQTLVAHVETPNGASTIVKFSVITGGFRNVAR